MYFTGPSSDSFFFVTWFKGVDAVCIVGDRLIVLDVLVLTTRYSPTTTGLTPVHHA